MVRLGSYYLHWNDQVAFRQVKTIGRVSLVDKDLLPSSFRRNSTSGILQMFNLVV